MRKRIIVRIAVVGMVLALAHVASADSITISAPGTLPASTNLTAEGTVDWAQWGHEDMTGSGDANAFNHKEVGGSAVGIISDVTVTSIGSAFPKAYENYGTTFDWTDGTPEGSVSGANAYLYLGSGTNLQGDGYSFTVNQATGTLKVYVGIWDNPGTGTDYATLTATLSGVGGATESTSASLPTIDGQNAGGVYTVQFSGDAGQTLQIDWLLTDSNSIYPRLAAATLVPEPGTMLLLGTGVLGVMGYIRRRRMK